MAPKQWSDLPGDILFTILKLLNSEIELLRLRSVCSSWRSSLPTRTNPYSFPMKLPSLSSVSSSIITDQRSTKKHVILRQSSLYRLSLPEHTGDPSDGWLLRVSEVRPNTFALLNPLFPGRLDIWLRLPPDAIPKGLNLTDFRISEICKCYRLSRAKRIAAVKKVLVLSDFLPDCDFAVLALVHPENDIVSCLSYWKFGDEFWTPVDTKDYLVDDVIFFDGKCYGVGWRGELVSFDSELNMTLLSRLPHLLRRLNHFVVYKSYLYIAAKINLNGYDVEDEDGLPKIVRMSNGGLTYLRGLKDDEFFLLSDYVSLGLSTKDFGGCKGNYVYMVHRRTTHSCMSYIIESNAVFDFDTLPTTTLTEEEVARVRAKIYWPPPDWLYHNSIQDPPPCS